ncbi:hypothetical protein CROQUDRAFT_62710 [Cronartium quercuum f. sp. fusiforme G11]|uniref:TPR repeat-containing protein n=1 Tax=Cronartium quercuum f. sp. fusiforme G11 TaxID=708437 RepID=A0A9P6TBS9_9BASI|nr:hypothetical protein CROQUDRAFT_62710 [Cronartium quercuum f. sp. fusiforme G11]
MTISREPWTLGLQWSLIDLRFRGPCPQLDTPGLGKLAQNLVKEYCDGQWQSILENPHVQDYFHINLSKAKDLNISVAPMKLDDRDPAEFTIRLTVIASLLSIFVQVNFTGPIFPSESVKIFGKSESGEEATLNSISLGRLSLAGEPAYHLTKSATFLFLAIELLKSISTIDEEPGDLSEFRAHFFPTLVWWELRAGILQRKLIEEQIPFSNKLLGDLDQLSEYLTELQKENRSDGIDGQDLQDLLPMLTLERGLAEHLMGNEKNANKFFLRAAEEAGLEYELTGILGKRTKFQEHDLSQLVVLARGRTRTSLTSHKHDLPETTLSESTPSTATALPGAPITLALNDDTLLEKTQFTSTTSSTSLPINPHNQPKLHPLDQSILLALSLSIKNTSPSHGLTKAQMAPFIERVLENVSNWSVHSMALLIRSRLEAHRSRTVERGLLQLQALVDQLTKDAENDPVDQSSARERVRWTWGLGLPSKWELERELGRKLVGLGVIRSAMEIFERLEMWEDVVQCHLKLDSKPIGVQLVKDLIAGHKVESDVMMSKTRTGQDGKRLGKMWCLLGELECNPAHWQTAWDVSEHTSSRAMRSLGAYYFSKGDYFKTKECLSVALKINPLFIRTWFIYGCAAMRLEDWAEAEIGFRRCIILDDEDAEAWNNLATVHLKQATVEENSPSRPTPTSTGQPDASDEDFSDDPIMPLSLSRPMAAFQALQRAVKLSYDSWRMWTNYMIVGISIAEYTEAIRALGRVVEIRGQEGLDHSVLDKLVEVAIALKRQSSNERLTNSKIYERLSEVMNRIILIKCSNDYRVWESMSELCLCMNEHKTSLEHQLNAYRVGVSQAVDSWTTNLDTWKVASEIVERTINKLEKFGPKLSVEDQQELNWKWQSKSILRSFLSKSKVAFEDEVRWTELDERLQLIKQL